MTQRPFNFFPMSDPKRRFDGDTYEPALDCKRLTGQLLVVYNVMLDGRWRTLRGLATEAGHRGKPSSEASVSARLRDLRKRRYGAHEVERRRVAGGGLHEYRLKRRREDD